MGGIISKAAEEVGKMQQKSENIDWKQPKLVSTDMQNLTIMVDKSTMTDISSNGFEELDLCTAPGSFHSSELQNNNSGENQQSFLKMIFGDSSPTPPTPPTPQVSDSSDLENTDSEEYRLSSVGTVFDESIMVDVPLGTSEDLGPFPAQVSFNTRELGNINSGENQQSLLRTIFGESSPSPQIIDTTKLENIDLTEHQFSSAGTTLDECTMVDMPSNTSEELNTTITSQVVPVTESENTECMVSEISPYGTVFGEIKNCTTKFKTEIVFLIIILIIVLFMEKMYSEYGI